MTERELTHFNADGRAWSEVSSLERRTITTADCVNITWIGAALLAGYHLWAALGLPGAGT